MVDPSQLAVTQINIGIKKCNRSAFSGYLCCPDLKTIGIIIMFENFIVKQLKR